MTQLMQPQEDMFEDEVENKEYLLGADLPLINAGYLSTRWVNGKLAYALGAGRFYNKLLFGDLICEKENEPFVCLGQKPGGVVRVAGFYGNENREDVKKVLLGQGFLAVSDHTWSPQWHSHTQKKSGIRAADATVGSCVVKMKDLPFFAPRPLMIENNEPSKKHLSSIVRFTQMEITVHGDCFDITPPPGVGLNEPHREGDVLEPTNVAVPHAFEDIDPFLTGLGFKTQSSILGLLVRK